MNWKWNQVMAGVVVGVVVGIVAASCPAFQDVARKWDHRPPQERMLRRFAKRLNLTDQQKTQVSTVLEQKRAKMDAVFNEMKPKFEQVRKETSDEIRQFLNADQQKKFEVLESEMTERFNKRFPPHP